MKGYRTIDPNANLREQLGLAKKLLADPTDLDDTDTLLIGCKLAELVLALDEWRIKGGILPNRWHVETRR